MNESVERKRASEWQWGIWVLAAFGGGAHVFVLTLTVVTALAAGSFDLRRPLYSIDFALATLAWLVALVLVAFSRTRTNFWISLLLLAFTISVAVAHLTGLFGI